MGREFGHEVGECLGHGLSHVFCSGDLLRLELRFRGNSLFLLESFPDRHPVLRLKLVKIRAGRNYDILKELVFRLLGRPPRLSRVHGRGGRLEIGLEHFVLGLES